MLCVGVGVRFVAASYDKTIRIFNIYSSKSREVYHTKRMQRVLARKGSATARRRSPGRVSARR